MPNVGGSSHEEIKFIRNTNDICEYNITVEITDYVVPRDDCTEEIPAEYDYVMTTNHKQNWIISWNKYFTISDKSLGHLASRWSRIPLYLIFGFEFLTYNA